MSNNNNTLFDDLSASMGKMVKKGGNRNREDAKRWKFN